MWLPVVRFRRLPLQMDRVSLRHGCTTPVRVLSSGQPLLVQAGLTVCAPTGTPLLVIATQPRVSAM